MKIVSILLVQAKVRSNYSRLMSCGDWRTVSTDGKSLDAVYQELWDIVDGAIREDRKGPLGNLWPMEDDDSTTCGS